MKLIPRETKHDRAYVMRVWRAKRDLSKGEAAKIFGVNPSHWSLMEADKRNASPELAVKLGAAMGQPIELFLFRGVRVQ